MEADLYISVCSFWLLNLTIVPDFSMLALLLIFAGLILTSSCITAAEVAFFSLTPGRLRALEEEPSTTNKRILNLASDHKKLLATILISRTFFNVAIIIMAHYLLSILCQQAILTTASWWLHENIFPGVFLPEQWSMALSIVLTIIVVTFILLLLDEAGPRIYTKFDSIKVVGFMSLPLTFLSFLFAPISAMLVGLGSAIQEKVNAGRNFQTGTTREDLDAAIDLTVSKNNEAVSQDAEMIKGIIKFGDMSTRQIMKPRVDVIAIEKDIAFNTLLEVVRESGYSRLPVYDDDFDNMIGILYVKDLIGHTEKGDSFHWQQFIRTNMLYVPETKKIDDLLRDFQIKKLHMAIVVDEFGGTLGIVTLDDIMEEVIGEIKDEFDGDEETTYIKLGEGNYIFEGKTLLNDVCRILGEKTSYFDDVKGNADSIGGLAVEVTGIIPKADKEISVKNLKLKIISSNNRRVEKINVRVLHSEKNNH